MTNAQLVKLAATAGFVLDPKDARNYPLPGNITMRDRIGAMSGRFGRLPEPSKDALRAMKLLDTGGVSLTVARLQIVLTGVFQRTADQHTIEDTLSTLWDQFFLLKQPSTGRLDPHFGHLAYAVSYREGPEPEEDRWDNLAQALGKAQDVEALLLLSHAHRRRGDLVRSLQVLDGVLLIDPEHAVAHFHRGYTLARLGQLDKALEANGRALGFRRNFAEAYNNRGYILSLRGELSSALDALQRAVELRPNYDDAHTNRAIVLAQLERFEEAQHEFSAALAIRPASYYAYLNRGITLSRQGAFNGALVAYDQALRLRPDYPEAYLNRGITLARMERYQEALEAHKQAIKLRPEYAQAHMHMGQTLANLQRYGEATQALNRAIELQRDYGLAYANRARTFGHMGPEYREAAFRAWQAASALGAVTDEVSYNTLINIAPDYAAALKLYEEMTVRGLCPSEITHVTLVRRSPDFSSALELTDRLIKAKGFTGRGYFTALFAKDVSHLSGEELLRIYDSFPFRFESSLEPAIKTFLSAKKLNDALCLCLRVPQLPAAIRLYRLNPAEAAEWFRGIVQHDPESPNGTYGLAICLFQNEQFPEAEPHLHRAKALAVAEGRRVHIDRMLLEIEKKRTRSTKP